MLKDGEVDQRSNACRNIANLGSSTFRPAFPKFFQILGDFGFDILAGRIARLGIQIFDDGIKLSPFEPHSMTFRTPIDNE